MNTTLTKTQIWSTPLALGAASAIGLLSALLADRLWDVLSWIALAAPVVVSVRGLWWPQQSATQKGTRLARTHHL